MTYQSPRSRARARSLDHARLLLQDDARRLLSKYKGDRKAAAESAEWVSRQMRSPAMREKWTRIALIITNGEEG